MHNYTGPPLYNLDYLYLVSKNNPSFVEEMVGIYFEQVKVIGKTLPELLDAADYDEIVQTVHKFISNAKCIGSEQLSSICINIETTIGGRRYAELPKLIDYLLKYSQIAKEQLAEEFPELAKAAEEEEED